MGTCSGVASAFSSSSTEARSKKGSNTGVFAGAVAKRIRSEGTCEILSVGAGPAYNAVKSVVLANTYLTKEDQLGEMHALAMSVSKDVLPQSLAPSGQTRETAVMRFLVRKLDAPASEDPAVFVSATTNPGKAAGLLRSEIQGRGVVSMAAMGDQAVSQALKTIMIAEVYLAETLG